MASGKKIVSIHRRVQQVFYGAPYGPKYGAQMGSNMGLNLNPAWGPKMDPNMGLNLDPAWEPTWALHLGAAARPGAHLGPGPFGPSQDAGSRLSPMQGPCRAPCRVQIELHIWVHLGSHKRVSAPPIPLETLVYEKIQNCWPLATSKTLDGTAHGPQQTSRRVLK